MYIKCGRIDILIKGHDVDILRKDLFLRRHSSLSICIVGTAFLYCVKMLGTILMHGLIGGVFYFFQQKIDLYILAGL